MPYFPSLSGKDVIRALTSTGYRAIRQRGSHIRLACAGKRSITIPNHDVIGPGKKNLTGCGTFRGRI